MAQRSSRRCPAGPEIRRSGECPLAKSCTTRLSKNNSDSAYQTLPRARSIELPRRPSCMNPRRLFVASCIALVASAFSFVTRGDILPALGLDFRSEPGESRRDRRCGVPGHGDLDVRRRADLRCTGHEADAGAGVPLPSRGERSDGRLAVPGAGGQLVDGVLRPVGGHVPGRLAPTASSRSASTR